MKLTSLLIRSIKVNIIGLQRTLATANVFESILEVLMTFSCKFKVFQFSLDLKELLIDVSILEFYLSLVYLAALDFVFLL